MENSKKEQVWEGWEVKRKRDKYQGQSKGIKMPRGPRLDACSGAKLPPNP
jgi:hypothetical protein